MTKKETFISKSKITHGDKYDYSKVNYINNRTDVIIICSIHGEFTQRPYSHYGRSHGCPECAKLSKSNTFRSNTEEFIYKSKLKHGDKYNYHQVEYGENGHSHKVNIECPTHGVFSQTPHSHLNGSGCPICRLSKGENRIRHILEDMGIEFMQDKTFNDCINIRPLKFDFYLPGHNICIEYDGRQHYDKTSKFYSSQIVLNDQIKNKYCEENDILLVRIPFTEYNNIDNILKNIMSIV